jgi:hypothetical protein
VCDTGKINTACNGGAEQAAEKPTNAVVLSEAKDLALSIFKGMRDSSSPLLLRMTVLSSFSAACEAPPFQTRGEKGGLGRMGEAARRMAVRREGCSGNTPFLS